MEVSGIYIYPVKSLGSIAAQEWEVNKNGFKYDRKWMLVDEQHRFLSQREHAEMTLLAVEIKKDTLKIFHKIKPELNISIPIETPDNKPISVKIWSDECKAIPYNEEYNKWFSDILKQKCSLVKMPDTTQRKVDTHYAFENETVNFSDGYPFILIGTASLEKLNSRLSIKADMLQFRPSIVIKTNIPFEEDTLLEFTINKISFRVAKPCARCVVPGINLSDGSKNPEILEVLSSFRKQNNKVLFGQNLLHKGLGKIRIGDKIEKQKQAL